MNSHRHHEQGSAAVEAAIAVPAFVLFVGLTIAGGRLALTHQAVESAAAHAARTASLARTAPHASQAARTAAADSLADQDVPCRQVRVSIDTGDFALPVGQPGQVHVTVTCRLDLSDLTVPGLAGHRVVEATSSSALDTWRERP